MGFSKINKRIFSIFLIANTCYISVYAFDLEIKLEPEIPTISTDISITVFVRGELAANVKWYWIINKEPNDFGNYPNDPSKVELKTLSTKNYRNSKIQFRRTKVGVYKVYLYVISTSSK